MASARHSLAAERQFLTILKGDVGRFTSVTAYNSCL
jgi:hypothetical protein